VDTAAVKGEAAQREWVTASVEFAVGGAQLSAELPVPRGPARIRDLLLVFRGLTETFTELGVEVAAAHGEQVTCRRGCGACCRQLVPIAEAEARHLSELIQNLPSARRQTVLARFAEARGRLDRAGLLERLERPERFGDADLLPLGLEYFRQGIPCPFLDDESCSIHPERPLACREYLVSSPAENCADPAERPIRGIPIPARISQAVNRLGTKSSDRFTRWVPLILAPYWADAHTDDPPLCSGPEMLHELFLCLEKNASAAPVTAPHGKEENP
jgi:Fe-S-cluster containining protein